MTKAMSHTTQLERQLRSQLKWLLNRMEGLCRHTDHGDSDIAEEIQADIDSRIERIVRLVNSAAVPPMAEQLKSLDVKLDKVINLITQP